AVMEKKTNTYAMYGIGEFKAHGHDVFDDFDPHDPRKSPDTIDFLVCWEFDETQVEARAWSVEKATPLNSEFRGQTHVWCPAGDKFLRSRPLAVVSLDTLLKELVTEGKLAVAPAPWPEKLPTNYL